MIRTKLDEITLRQYKQCLIGNTIVLHKGLKLFKHKIKSNTDEVFLDISDDLNVKMNSTSGNVMVRLWKKIKSTEIKLRIYIMCYQVLKIDKNERIIELLKTQSFIYNEKQTHYDNLYRMSGKIDQIKSQLNGNSKDYTTIIESTEESENTIEDAIMVINNAINAHLNLDSTLAEFVAANKILTKIQSNQEK